MKKILIVLLFTASLSAEGFYSAGSFSYDAVHADPFIQDGMFFSTSITIGAEWHGLYAETEQVTDVENHDSYMFEPYNSEYNIRLGYRYNMVYLQYEHLCMHGIDTYNPSGGHDRLTVGFDTRFDKNKTPRTRHNNKN